MAHDAGKTAYGPTFQVAIEQWVPREQRIVHDAVAYQILPTSLRAFARIFRAGAIRQAILGLADRAVPGVRGGILCRKRYIEETLRAALHPGLASLVILGAGFDTLAYRIPELAAKQVYEVDLPEVIETKKRALRRTYGQVPAHVRLVAIDFDRQKLEEVLDQAGYAGDQPSFFVWEGVTQYISEDAVRQTFAFLQKSAPRSQIAFTYVPLDFIEGRCMYGLEVLYRRTRIRRQLWRFGLEPQAVGGLLAQYGWRELEQMGSADYIARYVQPTKRTLPVMQVERMVHAVRAIRDD